MGSLVRKNRKQFGQRQERLLAPEAAASSLSPHTNATYRAATQTPSARRQATAGCFCQPDGVRISAM